jgi:hypothetical protein
MLTLFLLTAATGAAARSRTGAARAGDGAPARRPAGNRMPLGALGAADGSLPPDMIEEAIEIGDPLC